MIAVEGIFEAHITVRDLQRSLKFYQEVVGLEIGLSQPDRGPGAALLWVGGRGRSMLGIFSLGTAYPVGLMQHHLGFRLSVEEVIAAPQRLKASGVVPLNNNQEPNDEPVVFAWMPAVSTFFKDPDGNLLEYIAMLPGEPRPELGVLSWSEWQKNNRRGRR